MPAEKSDLGSAARARYYAANIVLRGLIGASRLLPYGWRVPAMGWLAARVISLCQYWPTCSSIATRCRVFAGAEFADV